MLFAEEKTIFDIRGPGRASAPGPTPSPTQRQLADELIASLHAADVFLVRSAPGMGRTTVLRYLQSRLGGKLLTVRHFMDNLAVRRPDAVEQTVAELLDDAIANHEFVLCDDLHRFCAAASRPGLLDAALEASLAFASAEGRKVIFGFDNGQPPDSVWLRAGSFRLTGLTAADYHAIAASCLGGERAAALDFDRVHRAAPALNAWQLRRACLQSVQAGQPETVDFLRLLLPVQAAVSGA